MGKRFFPIILSMLLVGVLWGEEPVHFGDAGLKAAVENELWTTDPTATDMLGLTSLNANLMGIDDLTGLEYATNLETLRVGQNDYIRDIAPLAGLTKLRTLVLNNSLISDLSPLSGLHDLEYLDIHENAYTDISPLASLVNLRYLNIHENQFSDISALSGLSNLETLIANFALINDVSPLAGLIHLSTLNLENNEISDISALSSLTSLQDLNLRDNRIADISPLTTLMSLQSLYLNGNPRSEQACNVYIPQIQANNPGIWIVHECGPFSLSISSTRGGSVVEPGEGVFSYEYGQSVALDAQADPCFVFAGWSGTICSEQNPETILVIEDEQVRASFVSTLDVIHVDDDGPGDRRPGDSTAGDPAENGTREHPFDQIGKAIEVAAEGATIYVQPGTYRESIDSMGKGIEITGENPDDPNEMGWPVIQGAAGKPVVSVANGTGADCLLRGLVLTGGNGRLAGAVWCSRSRLTMSNCLAVGNRASDPTSAAIYCADNSSVTVVNCTVADNSTGVMGAIIASGDSQVAAVNSILWGDPWREIVQLDTGQVSVSYSAVAGGWSGPGCTNADPLFAGAGYWANPNDPSAAVGPNSHEAIWVWGDYHLRSRAGRWDPKAQNWVQDSATSPCIDAGDPGTPVGREAPPNGGIVNMGAYGGTTEASRSTLVAPSP
jgi:hypothetical protein